MLSKYTHVMLEGYFPTEEFGVVQSVCLYMIYDGIICISMVEKKKEIVKKKKSHFVFLTKLIIF